MTRLPALMHSDDWDADVPSPVDLRLARDAREWEATAFTKRPCRARFLDAFVAEVVSSGLSAPRILELGSGPGFMAQRLLEAVPGARYTLLDFSAEMHRLAAARLGEQAGRAKFVVADLRQARWTDGLGPFDFVVTLQAVHELRHKRHALRLHAAVRALLAQGGRYLVCDHYAGEGGMTNDRLFMTADEQRRTLASAGFAGVSLVLKEGGLALHRAGQGHRMRVVPGR